MKQQWTHVIAFLGMLLTSGLIQAANDNLMLNIVALSTEVSESVEQDTTTIRLYTEEEHSNPSALSEKITETLNQAMAEAKRYAPSVKAWSGSYRTWSITNKNNTIIKWRARAEIVLESQNFSEISKLASKLSQSMRIGNMSFSLSKGKRQAIEQQLTDTAIQSFKTKAQHITTQFGFQQYALVDINVNIQAPMVRRMNGLMLTAAADTGGAMTAKAAPSIPIEAGETEVTAQISGRIQMQK